MRPEASCSIVVPTEVILIISRVLHLLIAAWKQGRAVLRQRSRVAHAAQVEIDAASLLCPFHLDSAFGFGQEVDRNLLRIAMQLESEALFQQRLQHRAAHLAVGRSSSRFRRNIISLRRHPRRPAGDLRESQIHGGPIGQDAVCQLDEVQDLRFTLHLYVD